MLFILIFMFTASVIGIACETVAYGYRAMQLAQKRREARLREKFPLLYREARQ